MSGVWGVGVDMVHVAGLRDQLADRASAFAEGTFNPVAQMGNPDCFNLFTKEELDAIQWDSLEEELSRALDYQVIPDYDALIDIYTAARRG